MATLAKNRARKLLDTGAIFPGFCDLTYPMLRTRKHVSLQLGQHTIRVEIDAAEHLARQILDIVREDRERTEANR